MLFQSLMPASNLRGRPTWFQESHGQPCGKGQRAFGRILCLLRSDCCLRCLDVCICADPSERASRSRFVKNVASWLRRLVVSQSGQGSREVPGPSVPGRVRSAPSCQMLFWSLDEDEVPLARRRVRADFPEVSCNF